MFIRDFLAETPQSDRAIRTLALRLLKQLGKSADPLTLGIIEHTNKHGTLRYYPVAYRPIRGYNDVVVGMMTDTSSPNIVQLNRPENKTTLPAAINYIITFPMRRDYRYPEDASFETMMPIAKQHEPSPHLLLANLQNDPSDFVHEFVHYWNMSHARSALKPTSGGKDIGKYYNATLEVNAYYHEAMLKLDERPLAFFAVPFKLFIKKAMKLLRPEFLANLDEDNRKRMISRFYQVWRSKQPKPA